MRLKRISNEFSENENALSIDQVQDIHTRPFERTDIVRSIDQSNRMIERIQLMLFMIDRMHCIYVLLF
jgi:hypothetical protein